MEKKMTKAQLDKELRAIALKGILDGSLTMLQIEGSKYGVDVEYNGENYLVRIDIVVPKEQEYTSEDLHEEYLQRMNEKEQDRLEREKKKQAKIAKDEKKRQDAKIVKTTVIEE